jgi:hypothetical protein
MIFEYDDPSFGRKAGRGIFIFRPIYADAFSCEAAKQAQQPRRMGDFGTRWFPSSAHSRQLNRIILLLVPEFRRPAKAIQERFLKLTAMSSARETAKKPLYRGAAFLLSVKSN